MSKQECLLSSNLNFRASDWMTLNVALNMRIKSGFPVQAIRTLLQSISRILSKKEQTTWFMFQNLLIHCSNVGIYLCLDYYLLTKVSIRFNEALIWICLFSCMLKNLPMYRNICFFGDLPSAIINGFCKRTSFIISKIVQFMGMKIWVIMLILHSRWFWV